MIRFESQSTNGKKEKKGMVNNIKMEKESPQTEIKPPKSSTELPPIPTFPKTQVTHGDSKTSDSNTSPKKIDGK